MSKESSGEGRRILEHEEIARSNNLITARYKATLTENKMTVLALKKSSQDDHGRHVAVFTAQELKQIMGHHNGSFYQQLKDTAQKMQSRQLAIEDVEQKRFRYMSVIDTAEFSNGIFRVSFNVDINKYIDDLKQNFTIMNMGILVDFTSTYAYRLYEILKAQEYLIDKKGDENGEYCIPYTVAELKVAVGCVDTSTRAVVEEMRRKNPDYEKIVEELAEEKHFEKWYDFKKNVLDVAERQINEKSDLHIRYELIRSGRGGKVNSVLIYISRNESYRDRRNRQSGEIQIDEESFVVNENENIRARIDEIIAYMPEYEDEVSRKVARIFLEKAQYNVERVKGAYDYVINRRDVKDFVSYMIDAISKGYAEKPRRKNAPIWKEETEEHRISVDAVRFDDLEDEETTHASEGKPEKSPENEKQPTSSDEEDAALALIEGMQGTEEWKAYMEQLSLPYDLLRRVKGAMWILEDYAKWREQG